MYFFSLKSIKHNNILLQYHGIYLTTNSSKVQTKLMFVLRSIVFFLVKRCLREKIELRLPKQNRNVHAVQKVDDQKYGISLIV